MRVSVCFGGILIQEYLESIPAILLPGALTWMKACVWLICEDLDIFVKFSLFHKISASN